MSMRCCTCLTLTAPRLLSLLLLLSPACAVTVCRADELPPVAEIQLLNVFSDGNGAGDSFADNLVVTADGAHEVQPLQRVEGAIELLPVAHTVLTAGGEPGTQPATTAMTANTAPLDASSDDRRSLTSSSTDLDVISEFETIAIWSGVVILIAGGVLVVLKSRHPAWGKLSETNSLQRVAVLQLRPDAQLMLILADQRRYLVALDRQGIRFLEPTNRWDSSPLANDIADTDDTADRTVGDDARDFDPRDFGSRHVDARDVDVAQHMNGVL